MGLISVADAMKFPTTLWSVLAVATLKTNGERNVSSLHAAQFESASGVNYFVQDLRVLAN